MDRPIENLIQILQRQKKKIASSDDLKKFIYLTFWESTPISKIYKITFQLRNRWFLFPLRKDLFYISNPEKPITAEETEEQRYRKLLKDHCNWVCKQRYIGGLTALEIHLHWNGVTIPETVMIINKEKQAVGTVIFEKQIAFKKICNHFRCIFNPIYPCISGISAGSFHSDLRTEGRDSYPFIFFCSFLRHLTRSKTYSH